MARSYARLLTAIWHDEEFLARSSGAQRMYMLAISQDSLNLCGVTHWTPKRWARLAANTSPGTVDADVDELVDHRFVLVDDDTEELWVRSFFKHDGILEVPNTIKAMSREYDTVASGRIRHGIVEYFTSSYPGGFCSWLRGRFPGAVSKGLLEGFGQGFLDGIGEPYGHPMGDGSRTRATEASTDSYSATVSVSDSEASTVPDSATARGARSKTGALNGRARDAKLRNGDRDKTRDLELAHQLADLCEGDNRGLIRAEAGAVIVWALAHVDHRIVEEALTWATKHPPTLPRAVAKIIQDKADDHGIAIPAFNAKALA